MLLADHLGQHLRPQTLGQRRVRSLGVGKRQLSHTEIVAAGRRALRRWPVMHDRITPAFFAGRQAIVRCNRTAVVCAALTVNAAQGARPLNTDDAGVLATGQCQFEPYAGTNRASGQAARRFAIVQFNCAVPRQTQIGATFGRLLDASAATDAATLSGKTNWVELKDEQTGVALAYGLAWNRAPGSAWTFDMSFVTLIASRQVAPRLLLHANLGTLHSRLAGLRSTTFGLAAEWAATETVTLSAETYGDDRSQPWASGGALWKLSERFSVNGSLGVQGQRPRVRQLSAGLNLLF
jgi:hypothetical protein